MQPSSSPSHSSSYTSSQDSLPLCRFIDPLVQTKLSNLMCWRGSVSNSWIVSFTSLLSLSPSHLVAMSEGCESCFLWCVKGLSSWSPRRLWSGSWPHRAWREWSARYPLTWWDAPGWCGSSWRGSRSNPLNSASLEMVAILRYVLCALATLIT